MLTFQVRIFPNYVSLMRINEDFIEETELIRNLSKPIKLSKFWVHSLSIRMLQKSLGRSSSKRHCNATWQLVIAMNGQHNADTNNFNQSI